MYTLCLDVTGEDVESDGNVDAPVEAAAASVRPVLEGGQRQLCGPDALRAELGPMGLVPEVGVLGHLSTLDVELASFHVVVAKDVLSAKGFLLQHRRRGREF